MSSPDWEDLHPLTHAVYIVRFETFHGMEVVVGKIELQADRIPE